MRSVPIAIMALIVSPAAASLSAQVPEPPPRFERETTIGCAMCGGPAELGVVLSLSVRDGRLLEADRDPPHVRLFDLRGQVLAQLGEEGDGPGELRFPLAAALSADGGITVVDMRRGRIPGFDPSGAERWSVPYDRFTLAAGFGPDGARLAFVQGDFRAGHAVLASASMPSATTPGAASGSGPIGAMKGRPSSTCSARTGTWAR